MKDNVLRIERIPAGTGKIGEFTPKDIETTEVLTMQFDSAASLQVVLDFLIHIKRGMT